MSEVWARWEGQVIDGTFPLERCIGSSDHSGVFLTAHEAHNLPRAALKLVPSIPSLAARQLLQWKAAANLSHPRLIRLLHTGRCQLGALQYLYVVMEYAEENLAQVLLHRALTHEEAWELLPPVLDALGFLHRRNLVQGQLKPSNILVVGDQLKLASDTVRPAGEATASIGVASLYDPPEARAGGFSTAGDVWALGVTLAEGLTRAPPARSSAGPVLPPALPPALADILRCCVRDEANHRPTVADLAARVTRVHEPAGSMPPATDVQAPSELIVALAPDRRGIHAAPGRRAPARGSHQRLSPALCAAAVVVVILACWAAERLFVRSKSTPPVASAPPLTSLSSQPAASTPQPAVRHEPPHTPLAPASSTTVVDLETMAAPTVVHEEIPKIPRAARETIHGHVRVAVRVTVDSSGTVVSEVLAEPGPSRYFAHLAARAARKWRFAHVDDRASRRWLVRFVFSRDGATGHAITLRS